MAMDQSPARKPKDIPFYETPDHVQTSAKIISEARDSLVRSQLRSISTRRPVTPQDGQRKLFGEQSVRDPSQRPPSAFSLGSRHFDSESRPVSGTRLVPLEKTKISSDNEPVITPKPPADPNRPIRRSSSRQRLLQQSISVENPSEPLSARSRSGSYQDISANAVPQSNTRSVPTTPENQRRVHSGPKERTNHLFEERGEGDGSEAIPRVDSRSSRRRPRDNDRAESGYASDVREGSASSQRVSSAGKAGSAGRREEETAEEAEFYNTMVGPIVDEMALYIKDKNPDRLTKLSDDLYRVLHDAKLLGKACKRRSVILKTIFKLLDLDSPQLLLRQARLILALKVSGNNLTNVCKLVFKVSKEEKHDSCFMEGNILDLLIETSYTTDHTIAADALVYCVGALKFLSGNSKIVAHLVKKRCIEAMARLLTAINKTTQDLGKVNEQLGHVLVQLTACLRNMANVHSTQVQFLEHDVVHELCKVMETYQTDGDLMLNVSRIFSKLTLHKDCCKAVASKKSHFKSFLHILKVYQRREDLIVRISFTLGNLTAKSDISRSLLFEQPKSFEIILSVLKYYLDIDLKSQDADAGESPEKHVKTEDVLIKLIRVIANLSINEEIGPVIAANDTCVKLLVQILNNKELKTSEELVLNVMATINNLSFYADKKSAIYKRQIPIAESLTRFIEADHKEGLAEAVRVFGNLTREKKMRDYLCDVKGADMMVLLLESTNVEVVFTAVGVLINLMVDEDKRSLLKKNDGIIKLIEVLRDFGRVDWQLAAMVCKTLWNYSVNITSANSSFGEKAAPELIDLLLELLDEEAAFDTDQSFDENMKEIVKELWKNDFCPVATQLLDRLEAHSSDFEPLENPT